MLSSPAMRGIGKVVVVLLILTIATFFFFYTRAIKPKRFEPTCPPTPGLVEGPWRADALDAFFGRHLSADGRFDFAGVRATPTSEAELDAYLAACAVVSPTSHPEKFPDPTVAIAYWLRAFDAMSVKTVLLAGPIDDLLDIPVTYSVVEGAGFFRGRSFVIGGKGTTLHGIITQSLPKSSRDPRVILAVGGPAKFLLPYAPTIPVGASQDAWLAARSRAFFDAPGAVTVRGDVVTAPAWLFWRDEWFKRGAGLDASIDDVFAAAAAFASPERRADLTPKPGRVFAPQPPDFGLR